MVETQDRSHGIKLRVKKQRGIILWGVVVFVLGYSVLLRVVEICRNTGPNEASGFVGVATLAVLLLSVITICFKLVK